jgi:GNAT superfamily N-acetyltransferase
VAVADRDGEAIGFITASLLEPTETSGRQLMKFEAEQRVRIDALVVQRSHWRRGAGRALVEAVERWAHAAGASEVTLNTYTKSSVSVPFYKSLGYEGRGIVFLKPMSDWRASE